MPEPQKQERQRELARRALSIARALANADAGERAEARRMGKGEAPIFWRQVARLGIAACEQDKWRRFTRMVAILTPGSATESVHEEKRSLGAVLADGGQISTGLDNKPVLSEIRLARLLAARGTARLEALERAIRMIARSRPKLDVVSLAWAVMNNDGTRIARDYYARLDRAPQTPPKESQND